MSFQYLSQGGSIMYSFSFTIYPLPIAPMKVDAITIASDKTQFAFENSKTQNFGTILDAWVP